MLHRRFPVAASFNQGASPTAEAILLVTQTGEDRAGTHDEQAAQVSIPRFGNPAQSCFAAAAVLTWNQADPGGELAAALEVVPTTQAGN